MPQAKNLIMALSNLVDEETSVLAGDDVAAGLPLSLLTQSLLSDRTRWTVTDPSFTCTFDRLRPVSLVSLLGHSSTTNGTWRVRLYEDDAETILLHDSGTNFIWEETQVWGQMNWGEFQWNHREATPGGNKGLLLLDAPVYCKRIRIDLSDEDNPEGFLRAGRLIATAPFQPGRNMAFGWSVRWHDPTSKSRSRGGQVWSDIEPRWRELSFDLPWIKEGELFAHAQAFDRDHGVAGDVLVIIDPNDTVLRHEKMIYGSLTETTEASHEMNSINAAGFSKIYAKSYSVEESL